MRFKNLDLNLLVALDAMLELRSISRAAERLHLSQSATSSALARLRDYFGDELLVQIGRCMELTPRAEALKDAVRDLLLRVDTTIAAQPQFDPARSPREFRILLSDFTLMVLMPHLLRLAQRHARSVRFQFETLADDSKHELERGDADLLIIPSDYCSLDHPVEPLFDEGFCCVVWSGSRLARRPLGVEAYLAAGHVAMRPPGVAGDTLDALYSRTTGVARRIDVTTFNFATVPYLLLGTDRIATMHGRLARHLAQALPLTVLRSPFPVEPIRQSAQWHRCRSEDPGLLWLRGMLRQAVASMDDDAVPAPATAPERACAVALE